MPSIGIIGAGQIGHAIATALARTSIPATLSNSRGPESLKETAAGIGPAIKAGTREEAASKDIVFLAVNWSKLPGPFQGFPDSTAASSSTPTIRSRRHSSGWPISAGGCPARSLPISCPAHAS